MVGIPQILNEGMNASKSINYNYVPTGSKSGKIIDRIY